MDTTLEEFQTAVRTEAIRVAKENSWCDAGLNETLERLGLAKVQTFRILARVAGKTYRVEVRDAESEEQARKQLKANPAKALALLNDEGYGFGVGTEVEIVEPPAQPAADSGVPLTGEPAPAEGEWYATSVVSGGPNQCRVNGYMNSDVYCTRPVDHAFDWHVASGKNAGVLEVWPAQEGDVRTTPRPEMPEEEKLDFHDADGEEY